MSPAVKVAVLAAVCLSELAVAAILVPRFSRQGNPGGVLAIVGSAVLTVGVLAYVLFFVLE